MNRLAFAVLASFLLGYPTVFAQDAASPAASPAPIAPPLLPMLTSYTYWPVQFVQWVGADLPYSMIELDTDGNPKHPMLYVTLTERATGKRIHYADNEALLAGAKAMGEEAHKTALAFEAADTEATGSISTLRFTTADGKPLKWRFVQGSDISEQGSGLSPMPEAKLPLFIYREEAAVAGEGTALQIGDTVSTASVWTEISQPPYFVAYRGAESLHAHTLIFLPGQVTWKTTSAPSAMSAGATWELDEEHGNHRTIRIDRVDGAHFTATCTDRFTPSIQTVIEGTRIADAYSFDRVRYAPVREGDKHFLALQFAAPLSSTADNGTVALLAGKKTIASGKVASSGTTTDRTGVLSFSSPAWLHGKTMVEESAVAGTGTTLTAHP